MSGFEQLTVRLQGASERYRDVIGHSLVWRLAGATVCRDRLTSLDGCQCWLPCWLPASNVTAPSGYKTVARQLVPTGGRRPVPSLVLVVVGVRPGTSLAVSAGHELGAKAAIAVDCGMRSGLPDV